VIVEFAVVAVEIVVTVKLAVDEPEETVTETGTVATAVLLLVSVTTAPPTGAMLVSVTVSVTLLPPTASLDAGASESTVGMG